MSRRSRIWSVRFSTPPGWYSAIRPTSAGWNSKARFPADLQHVLDDLRADEGDE